MGALCLLLLGACTRSPEAAHALRHLVISVDIWHFLRSPVSHGTSRPVQGGCHSSASIGFSACAWLGCPLHKQAHRGGLAADKVIEFGSTGGHAHATAAASPPAPSSKVWGSLRAVISGPVCHRQGSAPASSSQLMLLNPGLAAPPGGNHCESYRLQLPTGCLMLRSCCHALVYQLPSRRHLCLWSEISSVRPGKFRAPAFHTFRSFYKSSCPQPEISHPEIARPQVTYLPAAMPAFKQAACLTYSCVVIERIGQT